MLTALALSCSSAAIRLTVTVLYTDAAQEPACIDMLLARAASDPEVLLRNLITRLAVRGFGLLRSL